MLRLRSKESPTVVRSFFSTWEPGLRCEALMLAGVVWILVGIGVLSHASMPPEGLFFTYIPGPVRGVVWCITGLFAMVAGFRSSHTSLALAFLTIMPIVRLMGYMLGWLQWLWPGEQYGEYAAGWFNAMFYVVMIGFVVFASRIPPGILRRRDSPDARRESERRR